MRQPLVQRVFEEKNQQHSTRMGLYNRVEQELKMPVVSFYTSFRYPVAIDDSDAELLESVLQSMDVVDGFALLIGSPGGSGLAAERIANVCRAYSGSGRYVCIVIGKAKSAATIVCLGAERILMGESAELGTIDPQIVVEEDGKPKRFSVHNLISSYEELFARAVKEKGNVHPYLQQLERYDAREIAELKSALSLTEDMALKLLKTGMLSEWDEQEVREKMEMFLTPQALKVHGRPLYPRDAAACGLSIDVLERDTPLWEALYDLHIRLSEYVSSNNLAKAIETLHHSYAAKVGGGA